MKIVFLDEYSVAGSDLSAIKSLGDYTGYYNTTPEQTTEHAAGADIIITNKVRITREVMDNLPCLKMIAIAATGMNNVDLDSARERGIIVRNVVGYSTESVAESTLAMALSLIKNSVYYDSYIKDGKWAKSELIFHFGRPLGMLNGKRWGIIGLGNIGREVARLASAFHCKVSYYSTSGAKRKEDYPSVTLRELLSTSDIISVHCPLNEKTRGLIGKKEFSLMKPTAVIINVARGGIIDEKALCNALNEKQIMGAGIDTFSEEPLRRSPLYDIKDKYSLIMSPHNAWAADTAVDALIKGIADNIREFLKHGL